MISNANQTHRSSEEEIAQLSDQNSTSFLNQSIENTERLL